MIRAFVRIALTPLALLVFASPSLAQSIRGTVTEEGTGQPVVGAFVILFDYAGRDRAAVMTDARGRYLIRTPGPGLYQLRAERIGYRSVASPSLEVGSSKLLEHDLIAPIEVVQLTGISVATERVCKIPPSEAVHLSAVWEEARKALAATAWTRRAEQFRLTVRQYERTLDPRTRRVLDEQSRVRAGINNSSPFVSVPLAQLATGGYARMGDAESEFYGPDAEVLLSDGFVAGHCFRLELPDEPEEEGLVGIAFEPEGARRGVTDIKGVLWLDARSAELRYLEYAYTGFSGSVKPENAGGRIEFERLPNGAWIVSEWWIRAPSIVRSNEASHEFFGGGVGGSSGSGRERVVSVRETGGMVDEIHSLDGALLRSSETAVLSGAVVDSTAGSPLAGAIVVLEGTAYRMTTDDEGGYRLGGLPAGRYGVVVRHPRLDSLGIGKLQGEIVLGSGESRMLDLAVPSLGRVLAARCGPLGEGLLAVVGVVREADGGVGLPGATVTLAWRGETGFEEGETEADGGGRYAACGVPAGATVLARAGFPEHWGRASFVVPREAPFLHWDFDLGRGEPTSIVAVESRVGGEEATSLAGVVIDDATGAPLAGAQVALAGTGRGAIADEAGGFRLSSLAAGSYTLEIEFLGYAPAAASVTIAEREALSLIARLVSRPVPAPGVAAAVGGTTEGRGQGFSSYRLTARDIERYPVMGLVELIARHTPNVYIGADRATGCLVPVLRGVKSILDTTAPLIVVENLPMANACELTSINTDDIELVEVISGLAGSTRYGHAGRNGVIKITIKKRIREPAAPRSPEPEAPTIPEPSVPEVVQ